MEVLVTPEAGGLNHTLFVRYSLQAPAHVTQPSAFVFDVPPTKDKERCTLSTLYAVKPVMRFDRWAEILHYVAHMHCYHFLYFISCQLLLFV